MPVPSGAKFGPYEILAPLGAGGMGEVYRARDSRLNREVAVKVLPGSFAADADRLRRFEQEARAVGSLNHPNILAIYDVGTHEGVPYLVMELLEGRTLREELPVSRRKALDYARQAATGLAAAHAKGVTHRDLKPENLFVTNDGRVKILDFGLAKVAEEEIGELTRSAATTPGVALGTIGYMSPEQARGTSADYRADIFSLGVILYEMLSGQRAFHRDSAPETLTAIIKDDPPPLSEAALERIVRRCLEKSPEQRFQSASDLAFAIEASSGTTTTVAQAAPERKKSLWPWAAVVAIVLLVTGIAIGRLGQNSTALPEFHRITFRRGYITNAQFSNDGKSVIYSAAWDGKPYEIFSTQESSPESRALGISNAIPIAISKNGEMALIMTPIQRMAETPGTLARAAVGGGAPREMAEGIFLADWSPDGTQLVVVRGAPSGQQIEYPIGKKIFETNGYVNSVKMSPKGDRIALVECPLTADGTGWVVIIDTAGKKQATSRLFANITSAVWSSDGATVWFTAAQHGITMQLYRMDLSGHERVVASFPGYFWLADVAADGRLLIGHVAWSSSLMVRTAGSSKESDLYLHDWSFLQALSADGKQILFDEGGDAASSGEFLTFLRDSEGGPAVHLGDGFPTALSPDGQWAMVNPRGQPAQLTALPVHAGDAHPLTHDGIHHIYGRWLPDSKSIVFVGAEGGHQFRYYVQDSLNAKPRAISDEDIQFDRNADDIVLSTNGRIVATLGKDGRIQLLPVDGSPRRWIPAVTGLTPVAFCRDNSLLVDRAGEMPARVSRVNIADGKTAPWKELAPANRTGLWAIQPIRVAPDCESYAYTADYGLGALYVVSGLK